MNKILTIVAVLFVTFASSAQEVEKPRMETVKKEEVKPLPMNKQVHMKRNVRRAAINKPVMKAATKKEE